MKKLCKLFSLVVCLAIIVASFGTFVSAEEIGDTHKNGDLNDSAVRRLVVRYFREREAYLNGEADEIPSAIDALVRDEGKHRLSLQEAGVAFMASTITVDEVSCWDDVAEVTATEEIVYQGSTETVVHKLRIRPESGGLVVRSDGYEESTSGFISCSYVRPEWESMADTQAISSGSKYCIVYIASNEVGYTEGYENITKYGAWMGKDGFPWCASFVCWCANQAGVSSSVIKRTAGCEEMRDFFNGLGRFYLPSSYTPKVGDLFFEGGSSASPDHVGIITAVYSSYIQVVDGNCNDQVRSHTISRTDSDLVGYANPGYLASSHTLVASGNVHVCKVCGYVAYGSVPDKK